MGFNVSGIAINKNYQDNFDQLQQELGWNLEKQDEITFEEASSNWKEESICDAYFCEKGTLLFINMEKCAESWSLNDANTLTFALSETSMAFNLSYCEKGIEKRAIMEVNGERFSETGKALEVEANSEDTSEIIWNQMGVVLGKRFWDIDLAENAHRYVFKPTDLNSVRNGSQQTNSQPLNGTGITNRDGTGKWWQFWK